MNRSPCPSRSVGRPRHLLIAFIPPPTNLQAGVAVRKELLGEDGRGGALAPASTWGLPR